ncbi:contactin-4-like [Dendronephthya gigantea]|uniref:contactin-4-like n=1 Tax=Dendronephthya gigantea TaxID=151771 RepID=UPI00106956B0|nr:contactin-4-like [Dendronephthya gigantea]
MSREGTKFIRIEPNYIVLDDGTLFYSHLTEKDVKYFNKHKWVCGMEAVVGSVVHRFGWATKVKTVLNTVKRNMTTFGPKIVTSLPRNKPFQEGNTISMKCAATGRPTPSYSWRRIGVDGKEHAIKNGRDNFIFSGGDARFLVLLSAKEKHSGQYFCTATIGNNSDTVAGSLTFKVEPKWVFKDVKSAKSSIYSSHSWTCNATGVPVPTYQWYKNGVQLNGSAKYNIDEGTITFPRLEKNDTAMYQCVADNGVNNIYQTAYLDVQAEKPVFDMNTGKTTLFLGAKGTIKCRAKAAPAAENTWEKDGVKIDFSFSRYTLVNNEHLVIESVRKQDVGNYTCKAENHFGVDTKLINVQVMSEMTFISKPQDVIAKVGGSVKLKCEAKGNRDSHAKEKMKYKWKHNNQDIKPNDSIVWSGDNHSLVLRNPQVGQSGIYVCIAYIDQPSYAEKRSSAKVVIRGPPQAPDKVEVEEHCNNLSAKLMWSTGKKNYDSTKYLIVEMATNNDTKWRKNESDQIDPKLNKTTIKGLSPWTNYRFRVRAFNEIGKSDPSEPTRLIVCGAPAKAVPPQAPDKVEVEEHCSNFSAKLMWSTARNNYNSTKYLIAEMATNNDTKWRKNESDRLDPKLNKTTIKGLSPWTKYRFRVLAFNEIGKSDASEPTRLIICGGAPVQAESAVPHKRSWFTVIVVVVCFLLVILFIALISSFVTRERGEKYPVGKLERTRGANLDVDEKLDYNTNQPNTQTSQSLNKDPRRDSLDEYCEDRFDEDVTSLIGAYNKDILN